MQSTSEDMQPEASLEGWESPDMDEYQEASSEVDGIPPALHLLANPTVPITIPETQVQTALLVLVSGSCIQPAMLL